MIKLIFRELRNFATEKIHTKTFWKMNRRTAIKKMGMVAMSGLIATLPLNALTACEKRKKRIVLYFTGTGNCLYVARQFASHRCVGRRRCSFSIGQ